MARGQPTIADFASFIEEQLGLHDEAPGSAEWAEILRQRLGATQSPSFEAYRQRFALASTRRDEVSALAQVMTVGETYFFRDSRQFEALTTVVLPELLNLRGPHEKVHVLSVACSTGEEPYSVAIAARELLGSRADRIQIHAFDVNPAAIASAERAIYSEWSLRATPEVLRNRYFTRQGNAYALPAAVRNAVTFEVRNLFENDPAFFRRGRFDVILFRNALIYFSRRKMALALARLTDTLTSDGVLFLGNAESPRGVEQRLVPQEVCGSFCYRLADEREPGPHKASSRSDIQLEDESVAQSGSQATSLDALPPLGDNAWVSAIDAATRRLANLVPRTPFAPPVKPKETNLIDRNAKLNDARELIARERYSEALTKLDELVASGNRAGEVDLLRASILTNQGRFVESIDVCRRLLTEEPHSAGAYHLLGVASEQLGRLTEARRHHETAITLDRSFAMSHWLLGRLCLRTGQRDQARRYLSDALELWRLEAATSNSSTNLYSGGFARDVLVGICRADLARCEVGR